MVVVALCASLLVIVVLVAALAREIRLRRALAGLLTKLLSCWSEGHEEDA